MRNRKSDYTLNVVARWFVGLVFIFSSLVKGVDPMGTMFKVQEYMSNWSIGSFGFEWALPMAGFLSMALICAEFTVGVMLITGVYRLLSAWLLALMMLFFTCTTLIDAITNKVTDCGCFGDAIKLTNWQTFWKNVVLDVPTVWIVITRRVRYKRMFERDGLTMIAAAAAMTVFGLYNIKHEPIVDFRPWKIGNKMVVEHEVMNHLTVRNLKTGEEKVVSYRNGEWESVPQEYKNGKQWEIVSSTTDEPVEIKADGFSMLNMENEDYAAELLRTEEGLLIITIYDLDKLDNKAGESVRRAMRRAEEAEVQAVLLTSCLPEEIQGWLHDNQLDALDYYFADGTAIKAMMRGNPGFMFIKDAIVVDKGRKARDLNMGDDNL